MPFGWKRVPVDNGEMRAVKVWYPDGMTLEWAVDRGLAVPTTPFLTGELRLRRTRPARVYRGEGGGAPQRRIRQGWRQAWKEFDNQKKLE